MPCHAINLQIIDLLCFASYNQSDTPIIMYTRTYIHTYLSIYTYTCAYVYISYLFPCLLAGLVL